MLFVFLDPKYTFATKNQTWQSNFKRDFIKRKETKKHSYWLVLKKKKYGIYVFFVLSVNYHIYTWNFQLRVFVLFVEIKKIYMYCIVHIVTAYKFLYKFILLIASLIQVHLPWFILSQLTSSKIDQDVPQCFIHFPYSKCNHD